MEPQARIAELNDRFRKRTSQIVVTSGVQELPDVQGLIEAVTDFDDFTEGNDPYGEHDFGAIDWRDEKTFWKIDYYDQTLQHGEEPLSENCRRIVTIMLASEY